MKKELIKLASDLDQIGLIREADKVDWLLYKLAQTNSVTKEQFIPNAESSPQNQQQKYNNNINHTKRTDDSGIPSQVKTKNNTNQAKVNFQAKTNNKNNINQNKTNQELNNQKQNDINIYKNNINQNKINQDKVNQKLNNQKQNNVVNQFKPKLENQTERKQYVDGTYAPESKTYPTPNSTNQTQRRDDSGIPSQVKTRANSK